MESFKNIVTRMVPVSTGIILFVLCLLCSCKNDIETVKRITNIERYPTLQAKQLKVYRSDSGRITLTLKTPEMKQYSEAKSPYTEFPKGGELKVYNKTQNVTTYISANYAIYKEKKRKWIARHDVEVIDESGRIINTEYMVFDEQKGIIYSDHFTKFTDKDAIFYGKGFESDMNLSNAQIFEPTGFFYPDEEQYETKN